MTYAEIVKAWLAFRDLRQRGLITVSLLGEQVERARVAQWGLGVWPWNTNEHYLERMAADPYSFFRGHEWGADVYVAGHYELAFKFYQSAVDSRADAGLQPSFFTDADVERGVNSLRSSLMHELNDGARGQESNGASGKHAFRTSPFFFPNPLRAFLWEYGIEGGEVFSRKSLGGIVSLSHDPSLKIERVTDAYVEGGAVWGDVVFGNETGPVVRWRDVFRPKATLAEARKLIEHQRASATSVQTATRIERACPYCAESILVQARLCKHCHQRVEPETTST